MSGPSQPPSPKREDADLSQRQALQLVRTAHTLIYAVMVAAIAVLLHAGITGCSGAWLWISLGLVAIEGAVFIVNGMRCPLTALAVRYGAETGHAFDTCLPERWSRYIFRVINTLAAIAILLLALRWTGVLG